MGSIGERTYGPREDVVVQDGQERPDRHRSMVTNRPGARRSYGAHDSPSRSEVTCTRPLQDLASPAGQTATPLPSDGPGARFLLWAPGPAADAKLLDRTLPDASLLWTHAERKPILWILVSLNPFDIASKDRTVVLYAYARQEGDGIDLNSLPVAYADRESDLAGSTLIGLSSEAHVVQRAFAKWSRISHLLLSDEKLRLASALSLPTFWADNRREYSPLSLIVQDGRIRDVVRMDRLAKHHVEVVARLLRGSSHVM